MLSLSSVITESSIAPGVIFSQAELDCLNPVDIGFELASELSRRDVQISSLPMVAKDILCSILDANVRQSEEGVMYLAIKNISILFEEQLSLNVEMLFRSYSRVNLLFVVGTSNVKGHRFFPFDGCSEVFVDLSEMPYSVIYRK